MARLPPSCPLERLAPGIRASTRDDGLRRPLEVIDVKSNGSLWRDVSAAHVAYSVQVDRAMELFAAGRHRTRLRVSASESDPFFDNARTRTEFGSILSAVMTCRMNFLAGSPAITRRRFVIMRPQDSGGVEWSRT